MAHPVRPDEYHGDQQLLHGDRLRKGRRGDPHAARAAWRRAAFAAAWTSTSSATTDRPSPATTSCSRCRMRPASTSRSSAAGIRRPERRLSRVRGSYDAPARTYVLDVEQSVPADDRQPAAEPPLHIPLAVGLLGPDGRDMPLRLAGEPPSEATTRVLELTAKPRSASSSSTWPPRRCRRCCADFRRRCEWLRLRRRTLALLASHDSDAVNRWDAAQRPFTNAILRLADAHRAAAPLAAAAGCSRTSSGSSSATTRATRRCSRSRSRCPTPRMSRRSSR